MSCLSILAACGNDVQGAVAVSATRVVYLEGDRDRTLLLANTGEAPLLVQTWVDRGEGNADMPATPFVVLPAVLLLKPGARQSLRVLYGGDPLPTDRESAFWINLYQIPAKPHVAGEQSDIASVDVAMNLQLKVFYRPAGMAQSIQTDILAQALDFRLADTHGEPYIVVRNPTPFHVSFSRLGLYSDGQAYPAEQAMDMMLAPLSERRYRLERSVPASESMQVSFAILDDAGQEHTFAAALTSELQE